MPRKRLFAILAGVALVAVVVLSLLLWPNQLPSAKFVAEPSAAKPLEVVLDASESRDPDGEVRNYTWDFGDGQTGAGQAIQHTYESGGQFTVTLTVADNRGETTSVSHEVVAYAHLYKLPVAERWDSVSKPDTEQPPLFTRIEPADRAVVRGTEAWVRWSPGDEAEGRVLWHKAGEARVHVSATTGADPLLARLRPLELGETYEYVVEQISGDFVQRSGIRTFRVEGGVVFDPSVVEQAIERDHDQTVTFLLRNETNETIAVTAKALKQIEDLPADIVGPGSVDQPVKLKGGQTLQLRLAVFAADATRHEYEIPVEAAGAIGRARIKVGMPKLALSFRIVKEDPRILAKWIEVRNVGDTVTDLSLRVVAPHEGDVRMEPVASHALLRAGDAMQFVAMPVLYLEFDSLKAEIEATAAGQSARFPLEFRAPPGKRLLAVRARTTETTGANESYCSPVHCTDMPGASGNGAATTPGEKFAEGPRGSDFANVTEPSPAFPLTADDAMRTNPPRVVLASLNRGNQLLAQAGGSDSGADVNTGSEPDLSLPDPRACGGRCPARALLSCLEQALELRKSFEILDERYERAQRELDALGPRPEEPRTYKSGFDYEERRKKYERLIRPWRRLDDRLFAIRQNLSLLDNQYADLRTLCFQDCGLSLLENLFGPYGPLEEIPPDQLKGLGLPPNLAYLDPDLQALKVAHAALARYLRTYNDVGTSVEASVIIALIGLMTANPTVAAAAFGYAALLWVEKRHTIPKLEAIAQDPPASDFWQVAVPKFELTRPPDDLGRLEQVAWNAAQTRLLGAEYLEVWRVSYERFQGAANAGEAQAMQIQAGAMAQFARAAMEVGQRSARDWQLFEDEVLPDVIPILEDVSRRGSWAELLEQYLALDPARRIPAEQRETLRAFGIPPSDIGQVVDELGPLGPETLDQVLQDMTRRLEPRDELALASTDVSNPYVLPGYVLHVFSQRIREEVQFARDPNDRRHVRESARTRPGLVEAVSRRASFTRSHRGSYAAPVDGDLSNSNDVAAGWHAGDRVLFAWHQQKDKVVFVAFDPRGETMIEPQVIGTGLWPRLAADGKRTAVAWRSEEAFTVRLHDGETWGQEIRLSGQEAAIAFAPGGPLYAATSTGLWKLADGRFEQVRKATYSQPALTFDKGGSPHVAWQRDGRVFYDGEDVAAGEQPSVMVGPKGAIHLAYLADGSLIVRSKRAGAWSSPQTIPGKSPSWPTLARGDGAEVRLTYIGDADYGPPALWLARLPDKAPVLMPSLAGNVTDAWFTLTIGLRHPRSHYRPHDALITVNDVSVKFFDHAIPEGRYLFRLNPHQVFTSSGRPVTNRIAAYFWNRNGGANSMWANYKLTFRRAWSEYHGFASSPDDVIEAHEAARRLNHDRPDLALVANALELPVETPIGPVDLPVTIINLGEGDSRPAKLVMRADNEVLHSAQLPMLKPDEQVIINTRVNGHLEQTTFKIEYEDGKYKDFDPDNDSLRVMLWAKEDYQKARIKAPNPPPAPRTPTVETVPIPNDIFPPWIAGRLPAGAKAIGEWAWELAPRFNAPRSHTSRRTEARSLHYFIRAKDRLPLAPGDNVIQYVYLDPQAPPKQILLQLFVEGRKEGQAVYWGGAEDLIGVAGEDAKRVGDLPEAGQWVRLRVPVEMFGMENAWIDGLLFGQYGGRAHWGPTAKSISRLDRTKAVMVVSEK